LSVAGVTREGAPSETVGGRGLPAISQVTNTSASLKRMRFAASPAAQRQWARSRYNSKKRPQSRGRGASTDIIEASAKAYIDGLNKLATAYPPAAAAS